MPAAVLGSKGRFQFQIPKSMVEVFERSIAGAKKRGAKTSNSEPPEKRSSGAPVADVQRTKPNPLKTVEIRAEPEDVQRTRDDEPQKADTQDSVPPDAADGADEPADD